MKIRFKGKGLRDDSLSECFKIIIEFQVMRGYEVVILIKMRNS